MKLDSFGYLAMSGLTGLLLGLTAGVARAQPPVSSPARFHIEEATIGDMQRAIQDGRTTCKTVVQAYITRARAYNGVCTRLVTRDGADIPQASGTVRAGAPIIFPTTTVAVSSLLPNFDQYTGLPIEYGRMEATASDPSVPQQYGMVVGIPNAQQVNALSTLNMRGERSMSCKAECDTAPSKGPLPKRCPQVCEEFRKQPDALERAAQLDAEYGRKPDLKKLPMYCVAFSFKDVYDTTDMRSTGGADVAYAMDAPPKDSTVVAELRAKGAIIYAKANLSEYNGGSGNPGGPAKVSTREFGAGARSTWAGSSCNPYDTARETGGSSSGSAASVAANLVACSVCEETGGSCRQPAWRNDVVALVTTKGLITSGGAIGADPYLDRAGLQCRTVRDTALVLDALKDPQRGYFDPRDVYTALSRALTSKVPYANFAAVPARNARKPLAGMRIGIVREYMVKHSANDAAMSDQVNEEIKKVLRDRLGAELVESVDPKYPDDPEIPNMTYTFQQALAEILPALMPEYLQKKDKDGNLTFAVSGFDVTRRDYLVEVAEGRAPLSDKLNLRSINDETSTYAFGFNFDQYLLRRGDPTIQNLASLNAHAKYYTESRTVAMKNWQDKVDLVSTGNSQDMKMRDVMRMVVLKVMEQNHLDLLVNPTTTVPQARIGYASQPVINSRSVGRFPTSANLGIPEITVPAGFNNIVYEPKFVLNTAKDNYTAIANETDKSMVDLPLPVGISFWAGPGDEPVLFEAAAAYEAATKHRAPAAAFGPVADQ
jgi:Asp-tRNA(Asn)/Glu-tRNA(Gln) amidotransferase A subunit family amidase